jgi:hypothetical protein
VYFGQFGVATRAWAGVAFIVLTAPVAAHVIGRAAYVRNVPLWHGTITDELRGRYASPEDVTSGARRQSALPPCAASGYACFDTPRPGRLRGAAGQC